MAAVALGEEDEDDCAVEQLVNVADFCDQY